MTDDRFLLTDFIGRRNRPTLSIVWHSLWSYRWYCEVMCVFMFRCFIPIFSWRRRSFHWPTSQYNSLCLSVCVSVSVCISVCLSVSLCLSISLCASRILTSICLYHRIVEYCQSQLFVKSTISNVYSLCITAVEVSVRCTDFTDTRTALRLFLCFSFFLVFSYRYFLPF